MSGVDHEKLRFPPENPKTGRELTASEKRDPRERVLRDLYGLIFDVPGRFSDIQSFPAGTHLDPMTALPIDNDKVREMTIRKFSDAVRKGRRWAIIYADADNLKKANSDVDRQFGNMTIRESAARITTILDKLGLSDTVEMIALRQTNAADETIIWLFNQTEEDQQKIEAALQEIEMPLEIANPTYTFSTTAALITQDSPEIADILTKAKKHLSNNPDNIIADDYNIIKAIADTQVGLKKIVKDVERIPAERLLSASGLDEVRNIISDTLGNSRISRPLMERVLDIYQFEVVLSFRKSFASLTEFMDHARRAGISESQLEVFTQANPRLAYYNTLIH